MVNNNKTNYFLPDPNQDNEKKARAKIMKQWQKDFKDDFSKIGCFDGMFTLQIKHSKSYQVPLWCVAYALQKPFKEELEWLQ